MVLGVYGSGGSGKEVKEIAVGSDRWDEVVFIDDMVPTDIFKGVRRMPFSEFQKEFGCDNAEIIVTMGEPADKIAVYHKVKADGFMFANVFHETAWVSPSATIGRGVVLRAGVVISADVMVGDNVAVQENSYIGHDVVIADHCQMASGVMVGGCVDVGEGTYIGPGVSIRDHRKIGSRSVIGMGAVVIHDIPDHVMALGNPAQITKKWEDDSRVFK